MSVIEINGITKDYGSGKGVYNVSFSVERGEVFGFLGPNGAGKTTTIRQLLGFIKPDKGIVSINGMDCFKQAHLIEESLGYLPGEISFMDEMKGIEFIKFIAGMRNAEDLSRAKELIELFELDTSAKIKTMSKGMKQKIGIVCAFMQNPEILILDEPTSGLDPLMQNKFTDLILQEKKRGTTVLMSSHMFEEVERTCDRVAIIKEGHIAAIEEIEKLRQSKMKIFEIRFADAEQAGGFASVFESAKQNDEIVTASVSENLDYFLKCLSRFSVKDINMKNQSLEDLFMHFYGGELQ